MSTNYIRQVTDTGGTTYDLLESVDTRIFRATCSTAAGTAAKVATLDDSTNYTLAAGVRVAVTFTYGNSAATPTLNVNSGGAKTIVTPTAVATLTSGNGTTYNTWGPYETVIFTYNGTYWVKGGTGYSIYNAYALANSKTANTGTVTSITLTQGDGISIGSSGTAITTSGTRTIALSTSGATAGSYGPSANASPAHSGTFSVPYITVDKYGRVTSISTKTITLPASGNTDTKVTSVGNHYAPSEDTSAALSVDASSTTAATWNSTSLVTGVNLQRDAKGHVVGVTVDSIKMPANPNSNTTYTLSGALSSHKFTTTLTPSSGSATTSDITFVAGSNITLTDDTTNRKVTIAATDTNTHRPIQMNGTQILGDNTTALNLKAGTGITLANSSGTVTITNSSTNTDTKVSTGNVTNNTTYYPVLGSNTTSAETKYYDNLGLSYKTFEESSNGNTYQVGALSIGGASSIGRLNLFGPEGQCVNLSTNTDEDCAIIVPSSNGTIALTSDIPTKTSQLTNDSDFITSDTNVTSTAVTAASTYYLTGSYYSYTITSGTLNKHASVSAYVTADSSTSGSAGIYLGNSTASGTAGSKYGYIRLYGSTAYYVDLRTESSTPTANRTIYLPSYTGTMYLTCTSTTNAVGGATTAPVYVTATGQISAVTSIPYSLISSAPVIATGRSSQVTINSSASTTVTVTYSGFSSAPKVMGTLYNVSSAANQLVMYISTAPTTTQTVFTIRNNGSASRTAYIDWIAVEV